MPSISGTNAASSYSDSKKHPSLSGKGESSATPSHSGTTPPSEKNPHCTSKGTPAKKAGANNMDRGIDGADANRADSSRPSPSKDSANNQGSDNMGGGSSAIYSQGPKHEGGEQDSKQSEGGASTPAMPSMSGTSTATSYSDKAKNKSLSGRSGDAGSSKSGISRNPTSSNSGIVNNPTSSNDGSDNMGGGSSAIYSQGPRQGGREGSEGGSENAGTPAMPSMSGSAAATTYADRAEKRNLSDRGASARSLAGPKTSDAQRNAAGGESGSTTDHISGQLFHLIMFPSVHLILLSPTVVPDP